MPIPHGKQAEIAEAAGISAAYLCDILKGRRPCRPDLAEKLVLATREILSEETTVFDWTFPLESENPLIKEPKPIERPEGWPKRREDK